MKKMYARLLPVCKCVALLGLLWGYEPLSAQDIHFSQFNFSPLNQNPANTNFFDGDFRFAGNYRNQWPTVPVRFNTFSVSAEGNFLTLKNNDRIGGGVVFYFDRAGDSRFQALHTALSLSYIKALDKNARHRLSLGVQAGLINRSIDYTRLYFDNQWNGDVYDPTLPVNEALGATRFNVPDVNVGLAYRFAKNERNNVIIGVAAAHLNRPRHAFLGDNSVRLDIRTTVHTRGQVKVAKRIDLLPEVMFQLQHVKWEVAYGAHVKYYVPVKIPHLVALNAGLYGRSADAGWLFAGMDFDNLQVNLSYDINFSKLTAASRYNGGFEMSVIYVLARVKNIHKPGAVCPAFL